MRNERDDLAYELAKIDGEGWVFEPPIMDGVTREGHAPEVWQRRADAILAAGYRKFLTVTGSRALMAVSNERVRQNAKWGEQNHPNGTGPQTTPMAEIVRGKANAVVNRHYAFGLAFQAKSATDEHAKAGKVTWADILLEEVFEALAEEDPAKLRTELVQVAAVATQWVEAIDRSEQ